MAELGLLTSFKPESYLPRFTYFPLFFKPTQEIKTLEELQVEVNDDGVPSIIRLVDKDGARLTPFIDLNKYDPETKDWFIFNQTDRLPYRFSGATVTNMYPSEIGPQTGFEIDELSFDTNTKEVKISGHSDTELSLVFYKYAPIVLVAENMPFTDLTDYTNITAATESLSTLTSSSDFYYDFEERIHTNKNLASFDPKNVKVIFTRIGTNSAIVKCLMATNSGSRPKQTPIVYDYILKLKGQYLRG